MLSTKYLKVYRLRNLTFKNNIPRRYLKITYRNNIG